MLAKELAAKLMRFPEAEIFVLEDSNSIMFTSDVKVMYRKFESPENESIHIASSTHTNQFVLDFLEVNY